MQPRKMGRTAREISLRRVPGHAALIHLRMHTMPDPSMSTLQVQSAMNWALREMASLGGHAFPTRRVAVSVCSVPQIDIFPRVDLRSHRQKQGMAVLVYRSNSAAR